MSGNYETPVAEAEQTCGGFGHAPTSWRAVLDAGLESIWPTREDFEAWRTEADARIAEAEADEEG